MLRAPPDRHRVQGVCLRGLTLLRPLQCSAHGWGDGDPSLRAVSRGYHGVKAHGFWGTALSQAGSFVPCHPPVVLGFRRPIVPIPPAPSLPSRSTEKMPRSLKPGESKR